MKLLDFVVREAILVDLQATGKEEAIREMVSSLHLAGRLADGDTESVIRAILGREELGSTGIGQGVAVPHTRHPTLQRLIGTVALSRRGVDFARSTANRSISSSCSSRPRISPETICGAGEYFPTPEGRTVRQFPEAGATRRT